MVTSKTATTITVPTITVPTITVPTIKAVRVGQKAAQVLSDKPLSDHRASITTFKGFTGTRPDTELTNATWDETKNLVCSDKPAILTDKKLGIYFVPCELKEVALVGKTLENAKKNGTSLVGKMRSKSHVTTSSLLVMDIDGLEPALIKTATDKMKGDGISFLMFTTYSHGSADKPGDRLRLIIPLDQLVSEAEYRSIWRAIDRLYFGGKVFKADPSGVNLYQQQGLWCCHPDRFDQAKSWGHDAGLAKTEYLIKRGQPIKVPTIVKPDSSETPITSKFSEEKTETFPTGNQESKRSYPTANANKITGSCNQIKQFKDTKGKGQSEPVWRDNLGVVAFCENGKELCHEWSSGHSGYDRHETEQKIEYRMQVAPTTCHQFRKTNPEGCKGCPQTCRSPITLGWKTENPLAAMQQQFCLLKTGGKVWIVDGQSLTERTAEGLAKNLDLYDLKNGSLLIARALAGQYSKAKAGEIAPSFMTSPSTICYDGVEFNPKGSSGNYLNLWVGPTIKPTKGQWKKIKKFLFKIICDGDKRAYKYLLKYLAHALQHPEEKPGVMIILLGGQGTGKGTFGKIVQSIWSATFLQTNNIDTVTGTFNAALERSFWIFLDEALFFGNRRASDALKSVVTETFIQINEKYQPARQIQSCHRFIAATNAEHFKNTERDDRRDFTLRLSEDHKGDHDYWKRLNNEIENGGVEAMAHDLLAMDLSDFNVRIKPETEELLEQKLLSLPPILLWWYTCLEQGSLDGAGHWSNFVATATIIEQIVEFTGGKMHRIPDPRAVKKELSKVCPSAHMKQKMERHDRSRGYILPTLHQARIEFENYIGSSMKWGEHDFPEKETIKSPLDLVDLG